MCFEKLHDGRWQVDFQDLSQGKAAICCTSDQSRRAAADCSPGQRPGSLGAESMSAARCDRFLALFRHSVAHFQNTPIPGRCPGLRSAAAMRLRIQRINRRFTISTKPRYVAVAKARNKKKRGGNGTKPRGPASGVNGMSNPADAARIVVNASGRLGLLCRGFPAVRMTNNTSVWVARDSTNQPV